MYLTTTRTRKAIAVFTLAMGAFASPALGKGISDCYDSVLNMCGDAMEDANYLERFALGLVCTGMLAGCGFETL